MGFTWTTDSTVSPAPPESAILRRLCSTKQYAPTERATIIRNIPNINPPRSELWVEPPPPTPDPIVFSPNPDGRREATSEEVEEGVVRKEREAVGEDVGVREGVGVVLDVMEGEAPKDSVPVGVRELEEVGVAERVPVELGVWEAVMDEVSLTVGVALGVIEALAPTESRAVLEGVPEEDKVVEGVGVGEGFEVREAVGESLTVGVTLEVCEGVRPGGSVEGGVGVFVEEGVTEGVCEGVGLEEGLLDTVELALTGEELALELTKGAGVMDGVPVLLALRVLLDVALGAVRTA